MRARGRFRWAALGLGCAAGAVGAAPVVRAQGAGQPVRLRYSVYEGCPAQASFLRELRELTPRVRLAEGDERAPVYEVVVEPRGGGAYGRLQAQDDRSPFLTRNVMGGSCGEVVSALAFITALSIDPESARKATTPPAELAPVGKGERGAGPAPRRASDPRPFTWAVGAGGLATGAVAPGVAFGGLAFLEAGLGAPAGNAPAARVAALFAQSGETEAGPGTASFRLLAARLEGCPLVLRPLPALRTSFCAGLEAGTLGATGRGVPSPTAVSLRWTALEAGGRLQWPWGGGLFGELGGTLLMPLTLRTFVFEGPRAVAYKVPRLGGALSLGVGFRFR